MSLKNSENLPEKLPKTIFHGSKLPESSGQYKVSSLYPGSYGSSHARENVFGKLVGDKMAAAGALFLKVYSVKKKSGQLTDFGIK